jgi:hypothetical protein
MAVEDQVEGIASRKFGGVPLWVWGALVAALILGVMWWRNRNAGTTDTTSTVPTDPNAIDPNTGLPSPAYYGGTPGYGGGVGTGYGDGYGYGYPTSNGITTNSQWIQQAEYAASSLGHSQLEILGALTAWLTGSALSASQQQIVNAAIGLIGLPPDTSGIAAPTGNTTPPAATTPKPAAMVIKIEPSGSVVPSLTGQTLHMVVNWTGGGATNAFYVEESSAVSNGQWSIVHTFAEKGTSGNVAIAVGVGGQTTGTTLIRVREAFHAAAISNSITLNLKKPPVASTPKTGTTNATVAKKATVAPAQSVVKKP